MLNFCYLVFFSCQLNLSIRKIKDGQKACNVGSLNEGRYFLIEDNKY